MLCAHCVASFFRIMSVLKFSDLYSSPDIVRMTKPRIMRYVGHMARMGDRRNVYNVSVGKSGGKRTLGICISGWRIIFKLFFKKWNGNKWSGLIILRLGTGGGRL